MNRYLLVVLCVLGSWGMTPAKATEFRSGTNVVIASGETVDDDVIAAGTTVTIDGAVNGDVVAAGNTVRVTGPVTGSVLAAGSNVNVTGKVMGSVRAVGATVTIDGSVTRNVMAAGSTVILTGRGEAGRDLTAAGNMLTLEGKVGRHVMLAGTTASLRGSVGGGVDFEGEQISLYPSARVTGDLIYRSANKAKIASEAVVGGTVQQLPPHRERPRLWAFSAGMSFYGFLSAFVFGVVGLALLPRIFLSAGYAIYTRSGWTLLLGLIALVVGPLAAVIIMFTIVGLPVGGLLLVLWLFAVLFAGIPVGIFLGDWLLKGVMRRPPSPYLALLVGLFLLYLFGLVPIFNIIINIVVLLFGLGAYARVVKGAVVEMRHAQAAQMAM